MKSYNNAFLHDIKTRIDRQLAPHIHTFFVARTFRENVCFTSFFRIRWRCGQQQRRLKLKMWPLCIYTSALITLTSNQTVEIPTRMTKIRWKPFCCKDFLLFSYYGHFGKGLGLWRRRRRRRQLRRWTRTLLSLVEFQETMSKYSMRAYNICNQRKKERTNEGTKENNNGEHKL